MANRSMAAKEAKAKKERGKEAKAINCLEMSIKAFTSESARWHMQHKAFVV